MIANDASIPRVGERVILNTMLRAGDFPGEVIGVSESGLCMVTLDCQERSVSSVIYYPTEPTLVNSRLWQICWPEDRIHDS